LRHKATSLRAVERQKLADDFINENVIDNQSINQFNKSIAILIGDPIVSILRQHGI